MTLKMRSLSPVGPLSAALRLVGFVGLALAACSQENSNSVDDAGKGGQTGSGSSGSGSAAAGNPTAVGGSDANAGSAAAPAGGQPTSTGGDGNLGGSPDATSGGSAALGGASGSGAASGSGGANVPAGGAGTAGGGAGNAGSNGALPGDIAAAAGTPLVAAHSMIRAMYSGYSGKLFQVRRADGKTQDIGPAGAGGKVDVSALGTFCSSACTISLLYDQSGNGNDLPQTDAPSQMLLQYYASPSGLRVPMAVTANRQYLRNRTNTKNIPKGAAAQTEYFVVNTKFFNEKCCWDYGNMELVAKVSSTNTGGKMSALNIGTKDNGYANPGAGSGPWGMVDYEAGVYSGAYRIGQVNPDNPSLTWPVATVLTKSNGTTSWALKVGDAAKGNLITAWNAGLPSGYNPLKQEGGLSLGEGGDGSKLGTGAFFEGVVIAAVTSDATDAAIQTGLTSTFK